MEDLTRSQLYTNDLIKRKPSAMAWIIGNHYNPPNSSHPNHAGDLPPILSGNGYGWIAFYDKRFNLSEIIGKSIIIHDMSDDFKSQPAGNSGMKIGCGVIK